MWLSVGSHTLRHVPFLLAFHCMPHDAISAESFVSPALQIVWTFVRSIATQHTHIHYVRNSWVDYLLLTQYPHPASLLALQSCRPSKTSRARKPCAHTPHTIFGIATGLTAESLHDYLPWFLALQIFWTFLLSQAASAGVKTEVLPASPPQLVVVPVPEDEFETVASVGFLEDMEALENEYSNS